MPCASTRPSKNFTSPATLRLAMRESRPGGCSGWSVSGKLRESGWIPAPYGSDGKSVTGFDQRF